MDDSRTVQGLCAGTSDRVWRRRRRATAAGGRDEEIERLIRFGGRAARRGGRRFVPDLLPVAPGVGAEGLREDRRPIAPDEGDVVADPPEGVSFAGSGMLSFAKTRSASAAWRPRLRRCPFLPFGCNKRRSTRRPRSATSRPSVGARSHDDARRGEHLARGPVPPCVPLPVPPAVPTTEARPGGRDGAAGVALCLSLRTVLRGGLRWCRTSPRASPRGCEASPTVTVLKAGGP